ncbi:MAG: SDR family oxidoreductase [Salinivenus sp.]
MSGPETVLITGASSGIGRELAHCFARAGSTCVLLARSEDALHALAETLRARYDVAASVLPADLSAPDAAGTVQAELRERNLSVDVLVNNAGVGARGSFAELDARRQVDMVQVNVTALTHLSRLLLPGMLDRDRGGILNVASTAAFQPGPHMSVYYATKAYVLSFSEGLTEEVAGRDVTVTCLAPGPTRTAFVEQADMADTPLFRFGAPMPPDAVAQAGYDGFRAGDAVVVPGWPNKLGAFLTRLTPRPVARKAAAWVNAS